MFFVVCPGCYVGIEIPAAAGGPECAASQNVAECRECGEEFYFDVGEVIEEPEPPRVPA